MTTKPNRKLVLNRETLQPLQGLQLDAVVGGQALPDRPASGFVCSDCTSQRSRVSVPVSRPVSLPVSVTTLVK
ncbi:MAG: class I lanthipeptide [Deltaproteobacteria bacterium]|nr:class I lanthipeptide [Deltaproteobacteria bacterium]